MVFILQGDDHQIKPQMSCQLIHYAIAEQSFIENGSSGQVYFLILRRSPSRCERPWK